MQAIENRDLWLLQLLIEKGSRVDRSEGRDGPNSSEYG